MSEEYTIALLPGDGIGPEVIKEGVKVLRSLEKVLKLKMAQIAATITALEELNPDNLDNVYEAISSVWS